MDRVFRYYGRLQQTGGGFFAMPAWGRILIGIFALPGLILAVLSLLGFMVSILALLLLAFPAFRLVQVVTGKPASNTLFDPEIDSGRKQVDARIVQ